MKAITSTEHTPLPCPFCGTRPKIVNGRNWLPRVSVRVTCYGCHSSGPWCDSPEQAATAWNKRSDAARPTGKWWGIEYDGYADGSPVYELWECTRCGEEHSGDADTLPSYCPQCGAKMEVILL